MHTTSLIVYAFSALTLLLCSGCSGLAHALLSGSHHPSPPELARPVDEWDANLNDDLCKNGYLIGKSVFNPGFGVMGRELTTFPDGSKMYTVYETYRSTMGPFGGGRELKVPRWETVTQYVNRYDFYVDDNDIIVKCVPSRWELWSEDRNL